jgi:hypothetical protein
VQTPTELKLTITGSSARPQIVRVGE